MKFIKFIFHSSNRKVLAFIVCYHLLLAFIFNWAYPFAISSYDTPNYMLAAQLKEFCGYRPYGYSFFINFCTFFWQSVYSIVFFQSLFFLIASLSFIFTIQYFFPSKSKRNFYLFIFLLCISFNPFFLNNVLISDSLFISLSLLWVSSFIHLIYAQKINFSLFLFNFLVCFLASKVRYAGLIYPVIGVLVTILIYRKKIGIMALGAGGFILVFLIVYNQGINQNKEKYGVPIFSAFGGLAQLNNASVLIPKAKSGFRNQELDLLETYFKKQPDSLFTTEKVLTGTLIWGNMYPQKIYTNFISKRNKDKGYLTCYVYCGKLYSEYASHLIKNNTSLYLSKFYFPNLLRAVYPKKDDINGGLTLKTDKNTAKVCNADFTYSLPRKDIFGDFFAAWSGFKYFLLAIGFIAFLIYSRIKKDVQLSVNTKKTIFFLSAFFVINSLFLAYTHPILQRYLILHEFIFIAGLFILIDSLNPLKTKSE